MLTRMVSICWPRDPPASASQSAWDYRYPHFLVGCFSHCHQFEKVIFILKILILFKSLPVVVLKITFPVLWLVILYSHWFWEMEDHNFDIELITHSDWFFFFVFRLSSLILIETLQFSFDYNLHRLCLSVFLFSNLCFLYITQSWHLIFLANLKILSTFWII